MPNKKITAMPSLAGNQVPTDLVTAVDLSATPTNQNVKSTLNDLFSTITKNITDRAIRFQAPGSAPAVSSANQGALYHNGTAFLASSNGGAYEQLYTLSAQSAALVFAGPASGPAATPTFRSLALTDLPQIATNSLLGRVSAGTGTPEQITSTAALLTWLQNPTSNNLSAAVTDATGAGGALVFAFGPVLNGPRFDVIGAATAGFGNNLVFSPSSGAVNFLEILNAASGTGPTLRAAGSQTNVQLNLASKGTGIISAVGNQFRITGNVAGAAGILELRGGNASLSGGQIRLYEVITNGTNYIGFQAPDSLASNLLFELPATDGTAGQAITTDGFGILSWASFVSNSITTNSFLGRTAAGTGPVQTLTAGAGVLSWLQTPTSANLAAAVSDETGSGALVFATSPTIATPTFSGASTFAAGSAAAPALTTTGDTNTGIYFPAADSLGLVTGGVEHLRISSVGNFAFGGTPLTDSRIALAGNYPTTGSARALRLAATVTHTVTGNIITVSSLPTIGQVGTPVTVPSLFHYAINSAVVVNPSTLNNQYGYYVDNMNTGLINYGYYSALDTGVNTNWNFYVAGTAPNYLNGNLGIRTTVFGTSAAGVLALGNATAPTTGPADTIQIYSSDLSAGNTMLSIYTEGTTVNANATAAATHRIAIRVNGTVYYVLANTAA